MYKTELERKKKKVESWSRNQTKYRNRIKIKIFNHYGNKCVCCGESHIEFLTLDHINNDGGKRRKQELGSSSFAGWKYYGWLVINDFPDKDIRVLCMNCHIGYRTKHGCPHNYTL